MKIGLVSLNPTVGRLSQNTTKILSFLDQALTEHVDLLVFPELSLIGYPPKDLLFFDELHRQQTRALQKIQKKTPKGITVVLGGFEKNQKKGPPFLNQLFVIQKSRIRTYQKQLLPTYDVFDEKRYFQQGQKELVLNIKGQKTGFTICEDIWPSDDKLKSRYHSNPIQNYKKKSLDLLVNLSSSPFEIDKLARRKNVLKQTAQALKSSVVYVNQCGANDDLIFDGGAFAYNKKGELCFEAPLFKEQLVSWNTEETTRTKQKRIPSEELIYDALVLGIRDYVTKSGFKQVVLGLSGGIDSALVAALAAQAVGPENVLGVMMPSQYSSGGSVDDSKKLASSLEIDVEEISIHSLHRSYSSIFSKIFDPVQDLTDQNIQARIRGNLLMAISNNSGRLLLNTTNKSEMALGYGTLYGDMCGALAVISDLTKTKVYDLCRYINRNKEVIPQAIIDKAPSAELKPDQKDTDSLPPYDLLDKVVDDFVDRHKVRDHLKGTKHSTAKVIRSLLLNEYKRSQAPVGLKITAKAFGTGRRLPIVGTLEI